MQVLTLKYNGVGDPKSRNCYLIISCKYNYHKDHSFPRYDMSQDHRRQVWVSGGGGPRFGACGGPWCRAVEQWRKLWYGKTSCLQLNPKIMLIESRYISQLHFYSTIVRDFLFPR